jgi:hypothetical protein
MSEADQHSPPVKSFVPAAVVLMIVGWGGLSYVITQTSPTGGTRWAMFFTSVLALNGTMLPIVAFLNRRFPSTPPPTSLVVLRQAIWIAVYIPTLAWLQIGRVLTPAIALMLALGLILIEWLLRMRERSQRKTNRTQVSE